MYKENVMKKIIVMIMLGLIAVKAQSQHVMYPEQRTNMCFMGGFTSALTYTVAYAAFNTGADKHEHRKPAIIASGVSLLTTAMVYTLNSKNPVNRRQDATAWLAPCMVSITLLRIGIN
jgi:hypothetical protein